MSKEARHPFSENRLKTGIGIPLWHTEWQIFAIEKHSLSIDNGRTDYYASLTTWDNTAERHN
jgi:hypothetical protein